MSLWLHAILAAEGVGIVDDGTSFRLVRPPFSLSECPPVDEAAVLEATEKYGFLRCREEFLGWSELVDWLNDRVREIRSDLGLTVPNRIPAKEIMDLAPRDVVEDYLRRVDQELIPQRLFDHAESILLGFLTSEANHRYPEHAAWAGRLIETCVAGRNSGRGVTPVLDSHDLRFAALRRTGKLIESTKLAERIQQRRNVFTPTS